MRRFIAAFLALSGTGLAQTQPQAIVTVEASRGGAGTGLHNATIRLPLEQTYINPNVLNEVSYLFLTGAEGVPLNSITCTPYQLSDGTGNAGNPFNSTSPSLLSTNTVIVGSIVCRSSGTGNSTSTSSTSSAPLSAATSSDTTSATTRTGASSSTSSTSDTTSRPSTSSLPSPPVATQTLTSMVSTGEATVISTATATSGATSSANTPPSSTTSVPPGLNTGSSGASRTSAFVYSGLAIVGLAFAFTL